MQEIARNTKRPSVTRNHKQALGELRMTTQHVYNPGSKHNLGESKQFPPLYPNTQMNQIVKCTCSVSGIGTSSLVWKPLVHCVCSSKERKKTPTSLIVVVDKKWCPGISKKHIRQIRPIRFGPRAPLAWSFQERCDAETCNQSAPTEPTPAIKVEEFPGKGT